MQGNRKQSTSALESFEGIMKCQVLQKHYTIFKVESREDIPDCAGSEWFNIAEGNHEISVFCEEDLVPQKYESTAEKGWRGFFLDQAFSFDDLGVLRDISTPLATANIALLAILTFETDYIFVKEEQFSRAQEVLREKGYEFLGNLI